MIMQVLFSENQDINRPKSNLQPVKPIKSTNNSTWPYLIENPVHFIYEIKTKGYDVIGVNVCHAKS